jgi:hypothetical protein
MWYIGLVLVLYMWFPSAEVSVVYVVYVVTELRILLKIKRFTDYVWFGGKPMN